MASRSTPRIEVSAARFAIELKSLLARELQLSARQLAEGTDLVTLDHYRQAAPAAIARVLQAVTTHPIESDDVQRRVA